MIRRVMTLIMSFVVLVTTANAQSKSIGKGSPVDTTLQHIVFLVDKNPVKAIEIIRDKLARPEFKKYPDFQVRAFELLGDIYVRIEQYDLASNRFDQALAHITKKTEIKRKGILLKKGNASQLYDTDQAKEDYLKCLAITSNEYLSQLCSEGLAEILMRQDSTDKALDLYKNIEEYFIKNKFDEDVIRIQSKIAQVYARQNDLSNAQLNLQKAYTNANATQIIRKKDKLAYEKAKEDIIKQENNPTQELITRGQNITLKERDPVYQATERLKLADLYVERDEPLLALRTLKTAENSIRDFDAPEIKAEINKKMSEAYVRQGDWQNALLSMDKYEAERQAVLDAKEEELNQQIDIVKGQQAIDLDEKDFVNRSTKLSYERNILNVQKYIIGLLSLLLLIAGISIFYILKNVREKNRANKLLELKGLRAQMNPHFLFNALNTVNEYIVMQDERKANQYLTDFSGLMRLVLENSQKDLISLQEEIEVSRRYLELEHQRFEDKFNYHVEIKGELPVDLMVPPLLFQPYLENAIWHGLRYKETIGQLDFIVTPTNGGAEVVIEDNGIGRKQSELRKTKNQKLYQSTGLKNTGKRMEIINDIFGQNIQLTVTDKNEAGSDVGTRIMINL